MARFKVALVFKDVHLPDWAAGRLKKAGIEFSMSECHSKEDLARHAADADLVWGYGGRRVLRGDGLTALKKCRAILRTGTGTDNVDVTKATELGIIVANTPDALTDPVADHTISLLLSLVRQVTRHDRLVRRGQWDSFLAVSYRRYLGATLGLVGFGRVPHLIVQKLHGFQMKFIAHDPFVSAKAMEACGAKRVTLNKLFRTSDYVSLHCPLTEKTHHLVGEQELRMMQPTALLVNTSRGKVVDEQALVKALEEGRIAGAALDVLEKEPPDPDNPLLAMDNVILTPHSAGHSDTFPEEFCEASIEAIIDIAEGRWPRSVVNPEVKPRWGNLSPPRPSW